MIAGFTTDYAIGTYHH